MPAKAARLLWTAGKRVRRLAAPCGNPTVRVLAASALAALMTFACFTTACQPTPSENPVKNKERDSFLKDTGAPGNPSVTHGSGGTAAAESFPGEPNPWNETISVKPYPITVLIDADVAAPGTDRLPVYLISPERMSQQQVDGFLSQFGGAEFRLATDAMTKSDYQDQILQLQADIAKLSKDTNYTEDQKNQKRKDLEAGIKLLQQDMRDAPDTAGGAVEPKFTNQYIIARDSQPEHSVDENGNPETPAPGARTAKEEYESSHTEAVDVKWSSGGIPMTLHAERSDRLFLNEFRFLAAGGATDPEKGVSSQDALSMASGFSVTANSSDLDGLRTTYVNARALAENAVARLGIDYMSVTLCAKEIKYTDKPGGSDVTRFADFSAMNHTDRAYVFYFTRNVDGVNETYCSNGIRYESQYDEPWPYERLYVIVDDSGVRQVVWQSCGSKLGDMLSDGSSLLSFEQVKKIAVEQFGRGNIDFRGLGFFGETGALEHLDRMELTIDRVTLGYMRVKLPGGERYALAPVWDFFGSFAATVNLEEGKPGMNEYSREFDSADTYSYSFLTLNAIDGSVIDRGLGY